MKSETNIKVGLAIGIIAAICAFQTSDAAPNRSAPRSITINNTAANPVPVTVQNPTTAVVTTAADNPAFQPYATSQLKLPGIGSPPAPNFSFDFDVPAGKRLVIELVTVGGTASPGAHIGALSISTRQPDGNLVAHSLAYPSTTTDLAGSPVYNQDYPLRLYADPGTGSVNVFIAGNGPASLHSAQISISGYLVDLP